MRIRVLAVALLATALSGCWVLNELDEGNKKMDTYMGKGAKPADDEEVPAPRKEARQRASDYFANQRNTRTLTPGTVSGGIVSCKLKHGTQYMKSAECTARGGTPRP